MPNILFSVSLFFGVLALAANPPASEFPHVGFLEADAGVCTGTLLAPRWVLTAGHCVDERPASYYRFTVHPDPRTGKPPVYVNADRVIFHPEYHPKLETPGVDAALIRLESDLPMVQAKPLPLSTLPVSLSDTLLNVGYGENSDGTEGYRRVKDLRFIEYQALPAKTKTFPSGILHVTRGKDGELGCAGDSGSPLVMVRQGKNFLMGIYSTSENNGIVDVDLRDDDCKKKETHGNYIATRTFEVWVNKYVPNKR